MKKGKAREIIKYMSEKFNLNLNEEDEDKVLFSLDLCVND